MTFQIGDEVICVREPLGDGKVKKGGRYVIEWIGHHNSYEGVRLLGIKRDLPFMAERFVPAAYATVMPDTRDYLETLQCL